GNHLKDDSAPLFAKVIENNIHLKDVNLSHNDFRGSGAVALGLSLRNNDTIEYMDLSWNHLRGRGAISIGIGLKENLGLKILKLGWNGFANDGAETIGKALARNSTLLELDLTNNRIGTIGLGHIVKGLQKNYTLVALKLGHNPLRMVACETILQSIIKHSSIALKELDLRDIPVSKDFNKLLKQVRQTRIFVTVTGQELVGDLIEGEDDGLDWNKDPRTVLFEYMKREGFRVIDLFKKLDTDNSNSLTRNEFKNGLLDIEVPLTESQLDKLLDIVDEDKSGDVELNKGTVRLSELINAERQFKREQLARTVAKEQRERLERAKRKQTIKDGKSNQNMNDLNLSKLPPITNTKPK
ncbi:unnamed protein product, partial [Owenia fusiformis]